MAYDINSEVWCTEAYASMLRLINF